MKPDYKHYYSVLQALLVTFLWSTSFIIIKWGLSEIPPITYAGLRYMLAFLFLLPIVLRKKYIKEIKQLNKTEKKQLITLGLVFYTFTQGAQFVGLSLLPSVTVSLLLNFTPLIVAAMGFLILNEKPTRLQIIGTITFICGIIIYFLPFSLMGQSVTGLAVMFIGVAANAYSSILGRQINRNKKISAVVVTFISMGIGAVILLTIGLFINGAPSISIKSFIYLVWLAGVNTTFAFTLWNVTLRNLTAIESSVINSAMLIQIAILAWFFLGENITLQKGIGMLFALAGTVFVQIRRHDK